MRAASLLPCISVLLCACGAGVDDGAGSAPTNPDNTPPPTTQDPIAQDPSAQDPVAQDPVAQDPQDTDPAPAAQEMSLLSWLWCANPGGADACATQVEHDTNGFLFHRFTRDDSNMDVFTHHHFDFTATASHLQLRARTNREVDVVLALRYQHEQTYWDSVAQSAPWKSVTVRLTDEEQTQIVPLESLRDPADQGGGMDPFLVHMLVADAGDVQLTIEEISLVP